MPDPLWQSFANVHAIAIEANALLEMAEQLFEGANLGSFTVDTDEWSEDSAGDESDWVTPYYTWSFRVFERTPRRTSRGMLTMALSFYRDEDRSGVGWEGAQQAKCYLGFAPTAQAWTAKTLFVDGAGNSTLVTPVSPWRWGKAEHASILSPWFFCVRLGEIQSRQDMVRELINPLSKLFQGQSDEVAFEGCVSLLPTPAASA